MITGTAESDQDGRVVAVPDDDIRFVERPVADAGLVNSQESTDNLSPEETETRGQIGSDYWTRHSDRETHLKSMPEVYSDCCIRSPSYVSTKQHTPSSPSSVVLAPSKSPTNVGT